MRPNRLSTAINAMQRKAPTSSIQPRISAQRARLEAPPRCGCAPRIRLLEIVARVDQQRNGKQIHWYHEHDCVTSTGYRWVSYRGGVTYTGDSWWCPADGTASEPELCQS